MHAGLLTLAARWRCDAACCRPEAAGHDDDELHYARPIKCTGSRPQELRTSRPPGRLQVMVHTARQDARPYITFVSILSGVASWLAHHHAGPKVGPRLARAQPAKISFLVPKPPPRTVLLYNSTPKAGAWGRVGRPATVGRQADGGSWHSIHVHASSTSHPRLTSYKKISIRSMTQRPPNPSTPGLAGNGRGSGLQQRAAYALLVAGHTLPLPSTSRAACTPAGTQRA